MIDDTTRTYHSAGMTIWDEYFPDWIAKNYADCVKFEWALETAVGQDGYVVGRVVNRRTPLIGWL